MNRRVWSLLIAVVALLGCGSDNGPNAATRQACSTFRAIQADPPANDADVVDEMQVIIRGSASASVVNGARDLAIALESNATSTEVQDAIARLDAGCAASDL